MQRRTSQVHWRVAAGALAGLHSQSQCARAGACLLTFEAVLTGGGPLRFFLYPQYDTIARDHPILGGCQPGAQLHFQTSLAFTWAGALAVAWTPDKMRRQKCIADAAVAPATYVYK